MIQPTAIKKILELLPKSDSELELATSWQREEVFPKRKLFEARPLVEKLWIRTRDERLFEAMENLPGDPPMFEQLCSGGEGQAVLRQNIKHAIGILENILQEGKK